ncbi:baseplate J/gp47 family protein [Methylobacterium nodulans]|uniref:Baseplate J family protein n=1 Tax=Methylobacterium nodulans (strain LMG 21967 / CNCM I-2342 / ORS 2060) TaxID=460265 RepID=B8ICK3_METNO|nr:baseplate J/gp47 family protein [Methylobacterium nodulans]ACL57414.1 Baseplate J family protein [Methylobacterium nodulans ORS 2060]
MAGYNIRSLAELGSQARKYFTQAVEGAVALVWANTFTVFAKVLALLDFEHEQRRAWLFKQMFASTADEIWLVRHAFELGLAQGAGQTAFGRVTVAATPGLVVPAGLTWVREDGLTYTTLAQAIAAGNSVTLYVEADLVGEVGNVAAGTELTLSPDSDAPEALGTVATVVAAEDGSGLSGGIDAEDLESLRARVLARKRNPPHGGAEGDYIAWVTEALPGVVRAVWVDSFSNDARSVWVMFTVADQPNGIPTAAQVATVQAHIDDGVRRPVTARVFVSAPIAHHINLLIAGLSPDTPDIRDAIAAEVEAVFVDRAEPGKPTKGAFALSRSWLTEAISRATGEDRHRLVTPADDLVFGPGQLPVPGLISYTD